MAPNKDLFPLKRYRRFCGLTQLFCWFVATMCTRKQNPNANWEMRNIAFPILNALSGIFLYLIGRPCTTIHLLPLNDGRLFVFFRFCLKEFKWVFKNVHFVPSSRDHCQATGVLDCCVWRLDYGKTTGWISMTFCGRALHGIEPIKYCSRFESQGGHTNCFSLSLTCKIGYLASAEVCTLQVPF